MFINLFDETKDLASRYEKFASDAEEIRIKYDNGTWRNHYQSTNAISTYLWLRYGNCLSSNKDKCDKF
jgi:5-methylcytosine-specific restriction protein B